MTDLLTKEEREVVERIRENHEKTYAHHGWNPSGDIGKMFDERKDLLAIIDNLSKRGVKKYSEEELYKEIR